MEDWQLPSFVANSTSASDNAPAKRTPVVTHVTLNFGDSHPSSSSASKESTRTASTSRTTTTGTASTSGTKSARTASTASAKSDKIISASTPKPDKISSHNLTDKSLKTSHLTEPSLASTSKSDSSAPAFHATASTKGTMDHAFVQAARNGFSAAKTAFAGRLARLTAYWAGEGDYYTGRHLSSTGIHLHGGVCAVDPSIIPYGSVVVIPGVGQFLAADTGSAVVSRTAAREAGRTLAERSALVIDIFFDHRSDGEAFAAQEQKFVPISWWTPSSTSNAAQAARSVFADENWNKIYSKQL